MKKAIPLFVVCLLLFAFCACVEKYNKTLDLLGASFSWDMNHEQAKAFIDQNKVNAKMIEIKDYDSFSSVTDGYYTIRFNKMGKIDVVTINTGSNSPDQWLAYLISMYGNYDKMDTIENDNYYTWYGKLAEKRCRMVFHTNHTLKTCYINFRRDES